VSEEEAEQYRRAYLDLLGELDREQRHWRSLEQTMLASTGDTP